MECWSVRGGAQGRIVENLTGIKAGEWPMGENAIVKAAIDSMTPVELTPAVQVTRAFANKRLVREWKTIEAIIRIYCRDRHCHSGPCAKCSQLLDYAGLRLDRCRFGAEKPTCAHCPVHCYHRDRREQIKAVMRYAGPRMLWRHPVRSLQHWLDGFRKAPAYEQNS